MNIDQTTSWLDQMKNNIIDRVENNNSKKELIDYIKSYQPLNLGLTPKRKRIKTNVPAEERCRARAANNNQCTRRKKHESNFCGTHIKGAPNGIIDDTYTTGNTKQIFTIDINGILHWVDKEGNIYRTSDIISENTPEIIGKYKTRIEDDKKIYYIL